MSKLRTMLRSLTWLFVTIGIGISTAVSAEIVKLGAVIDPNQAVPAVTSDGVGAATVSFDTDTNLLTWEISFSNLTGPAVAAHFHGPAARGVSAGVAVGIDAVSGTESPLQGSATLTDVQETELLAGMWYVNIHTEANGGGEIRGQVETVIDFTASLDGAQQTPAVTTAGMGSGFLALNTVSNEIQWHVSFEDLSGPAVDAHIHGPAAIGQPAGVIVPLSGGGLDSPLSGSATITDATDLLAELWYFNIHTDMFPSGEIRGQILNAASQTPLTAAALVAAVLPSGRSVQVGGTATVFGTAINNSDIAATGCYIKPTAALDGTFLFQTTDPLTNELVGQTDRVVDIPPHGSQSFLLAITPASELPPTSIAFDFDCTNSEPAASLPVNRITLSASTTPVADIIAIALTPTADGAVAVDNTPGSTGFFVVATANVGASDDVTATADTGGVQLPVSLTICETDPATSVCLQPPIDASLGVSRTINSGDFPTYAVFATVDGDIANDPGVNRINVVFADAGAVQRGSTSVALSTIEGGGGPPVAPTEVPSTAVAVLERVLEILFGGAANPVAIQSNVPMPVDVTLPCGNGQVTFVGEVDTDVSPFTVEGTMGLTDCETINGSLDLAGSGTVALSISISLTLDGSISAEQCSAVNFSNFTVDTTATQLGVINSPIIGNGSVSGNCEGTDFSCSLNNVDVLDEAALAQSCS